MARPVDTVPARVTEDGALVVTVQAEDPLVVDSGSLSGDGRKTVTTAGTREALAASTAAKWVAITALDDNGGAVVVGGASTVVAALASRRGTPLMAGEDLTLPVSDLADVGLDVEVSGDGVSFIYGTA